MVDICTICLESINETDKIIRLPNCQHIFHSQCFCNFASSNLDNEHTRLLCPICREICISIREENSNLQQQQQQPLVLVQETHRHGFYNILLCMFLFNMFLFFCSMFLNQ